MREIDRGSSSIESSGDFYFSLIIINKSYKQSVNIKELIKISEREGKQVVSARELYIGLGLDKSNWSRWATQNIVEDDFFKENEDWVGVRHNDER